ncbi:MAG TPA: hypothetical protein VMW27_25605 [Thermoanaerobaculia bacterium]|nr:hypothetical protein [Thermoanaerobaculia bacterium]
MKKHARKARWIVTTSRAIGELLMSRRTGVRLLTVVLVFASLPARSWGHESQHLARQHEGPPAVPERLRAVFAETKWTVEDVARLAYESLARYARISGTPVHFSIRDVRTIDIGALGETRLSQLVTMPGGRVIRFFVSQFKTSTAAGISYEGRWVDNPPIPQEELRVAEEIYARDALRSSKEGRQVFAVTSYEVTAGLGDETRTYRAAIFWLDAKSMQTQFVVTDNVTERVDEALLERLPAAPLATSRALPVERWPAMLKTSSTALQKASCLALGTRHNQSPSYGRSEDTNHTSGQHTTAFTMGWDCSCAADCTATCVPTPDWTDCNDAGSVKFSKRHVPRTKWSFQGSSLVSEKAPCAGGWGCFVQECALWGCGSWTISAGVSSTSISFDFTGESVMDGQYSHNAECPACIPRPSIDPPPPPPPNPDGTGGSPLVIDLDGGGFRFTDGAGGVQFDLNGDQIAETLAWLEPGSGDGFLVLDRDGNGSITSGAEMFGDRTAQPTSPEPNGFLALAVFDQASAGGNVDGTIDVTDAIFPLLAIWIDVNHDGRSQDGELYTLASLGISSFRLDYIETRQKDRYGNELRYRSRATVGGKTVPVVDVFFVSG